MSLLSSHAARLCLASALAACFAAGCSNDSTGDDVDPSSSDDAIISGDDLACRAKILAYKAAHRGAPKLKIVGDPENKPFSYLENGELTGWEVEYTDALMKAIGRDYTLEPKKWGAGCCGLDPNDPTKGAPPPAADTIFSTIYSGGADFGFASISNGAVRKTLFPMSERYGFTMESKQFEYRADRAKELNFADHGINVLDKKIVAVQRGTNHYYYVTRVLKGEKHLDIEVQEHDSQGAAATAAANGDAHYSFGFTTDLVTSNFIKDKVLVEDSKISELDPQGLATVWGQGATFPFRPSIAQDDPALVEVVDCAIKNLTNRHLPEQLNRKWAKATAHSYLYCPPSDTDEQCSARP